MVSSGITEQLQKLESKPSPSLYNELIQSVMIKYKSPPLVEDCNAIAESLLGENLGIVAARPLLSTFISALGALPSAETRIEAGQHVLSLLSPRVVSFEEQDGNVREMLASAYESEEEWTEAAKVLQGIQLESSQRKITDDEKVKIWIRITRNYLEEDDTTNAETYLNRAKNVLYKCQDRELQLHFDLSQARILDAKRKFLDACRSYHNLSFSPIIAEEERLRALSAAMVCAVLAPAGPQRSRALGRLYKDDRASQVDEYAILEKMFLDRLLTPEDVDAFAQKLSPHQKATTADGSTVLAKAVIEHNLLGASRLYENIATSSLGHLLNLSAEQAEGYAARMIEQGRLNGRIDQIDQLIFFDNTDPGGDKPSTGLFDGTPGRELRRWDANVQGVAEELEKVVTLLQNTYPEFVAANMAH